MIIWMLYSAFVALIVAGAARAAEWLARLVGYRVRWIWFGALALTMFLSAAAALRGRDAQRIGAPSTVDLNVGANGYAETPWLRALRMDVERLHRSLDAPLRSAAAIVDRATSPAANLYAALLAAAVSLGIVLVLAGVGRRFRRARREWPLAKIHDVDVRVAPRVGPVVLGFVRPEIVVPRWLLARHPDEQRLVVTHEDEHVRARDPLLLGVAWGAVAAVPWNPAVWYIVSRLRLAIELDCDARVLRRGAAPRSYGALLIDVAEHASALRPSVLALADDSHLRQRIVAMRRVVPRFARLRGGLAAACALAGILVVCQATLPDAASKADPRPQPSHLAARSKAPFRGLVFVDGARAAVSQMALLDRSEIATVDVLKGDAATARYGTNAVNGVILITTKRGAGTK